MSDVLDLTITEASRLLRSGEISSRELTKACLEQIQDLDPQIHAFLTLTEQEAMFRANRADYHLAEHRRDSSVEVHPLEGIPIAVKDVHLDLGCSLHVRIQNP